MKLKHVVSQGVTGTKSEPEALYTVRSSVVWEVLGASFRALLSISQDSRQHSLFVIRNGYLFASNLKGKGRRCVSIDRNVWHNCDGEVITEDCFSGAWKRPLFPEIVNHHVVNAFFDVLVNFWHNELAFLCVYFRPSWHRLFATPVHTNSSEKVVVASRKLFLSHVPNFSVKSSAIYFVRRTKWQEIVVDPRHKQR